ncbi:DUF6907 domain-containing protein [Nocardioides jishulii]|uniref:Uncharacterized protein n=1 Tax=Nocardioides jishulii TaxID=2575440 RepID=A0A4V5TJS0_9ACTN|nr:hypothetical protein [Nocardioides jishulii]QCX28089.1 hypothetical protein FCL41_11595 [Nocardioides jishulii]TKI60753.1 hypothetical protein FC770_14670 [Nocardioides jishulii]
MSAVANCPAWCVSAHEVESTHAEDRAFAVGYHEGQATEVTCTSKALLPLAGRVVELPLTLVVQPEEYVSAGRPVALVRLGEKGADGWELTQAEARRVGRALLEAAETYR